MLKLVIPAFVIVVVLLLTAVLLMAFRPLFTKNGKFPNIHIGGNKAMRDRGITCATSQDCEARNKTK